MNEKLTPAWTEFHYHSVQARLWRCPKRFPVVVAGRGSGKTEMAKRFLVRHLPIKKPWPVPRYFYAAPTLPQAKRIAWDHLQSLIPKSWIKKVMVSECKIETVFGSQLYVVGMDKPQRIEGDQWDGGIFDECSDQRPGAFVKSVFPALSWRRGWCWRIGAPKRQGIGAAEFRDAFEMAHESPDAEAFTWSSEGIVPEDAIKAARKIMDAIDFQEQFGGVFQNLTGGIFYAFNEEYNVRPVTYRPELPVVVGCDFNVDPMAWVIGHRFRNSVEWFDELWLRDSNTQGALNTLWQRYQHHKAGFEFYGDASSASRSTDAYESDYIQIAKDERFKRAGRTVHFPRSNPAKADRFAACNAMLCNADDERRLFVDPNCKQLIKDLKARTYKPGSREPADTGDIGHITDAMGYVVHRLFPIRLLDSLPPQVITTTG